METVVNIDTMQFLFQPWIRYIEHKADSPKNILNMIFERALKELPGSYKLWYNYLKVIQLTPWKFGECDMIGFNQININQFYLTLGNLNKTMNFKFD